MSDKIKYLSDENFDNETNTGVILVDFYADWCGPCRMLSPILEELAGELDGKATIAKVDIDSSQKVTDRFGVTSIPTLVLLKDGQVIDKVVGLRDFNALKKMIHDQL